MALIKTSILLLCIGGLLAFPGSKRGCRSLGCEPGGELIFEQEHQDDITHTGIENVSSREIEKKGQKCTSRMCWFRPGKREAKRKCRSPMCWFRAGGKRQETDERQSSKRTNSDALLTRIIKEAKRSVRNELSKRLSRDGCKSPMCWFRPGREITKRASGFRNKAEKDSSVAVGEQSPRHSDAQRKRTAATRTSKMSWFRPGKRATRRKCTSPMCWFRGAGKRQQWKGIDENLANNNNKRVEVQDAAASGFDTGHDTQKAHDTQAAYAEDQRNQRSIYDGSKLVNTEDENQDHSQFSQLTLSLWEKEA